VSASCCIGSLATNGMIGPGKTMFKKLKILLDQMMFCQTKVCFFFPILPLISSLKAERADDLCLPLRIIGTFSPVF